MTFVGLSVLFWPLVASIRGNSHTISIHESHFERILATAVVISQSNLPRLSHLQLIDSTVLDHTVFRDCRNTHTNVFEHAVGGAILAVGTSVTVSDCSFDNNTARYAGSAAFTRSEIAISGSCINNNYGLKDIGGIWAMTCTTAMISQSNFTNNIAERYCGGFCLNASTSTLSFVVVNGNRGGESVGGGALIDYDSSSVVDHVVFEANKCDGNEISPGLWIQGRNHTVYLSNAFFGTNLQITTSKSSAIYAYGTVTIVFSDMVCVAEQELPPIVQDPNAKVTVIGSFDTPEKCAGVLQTPELPNFEQRRKISFHDVLITVIPLWI